MAIALVVFVATFVGAVSGWTQPIEKTPACATVCLHSAPDWWRVNEGTAGAALLVHEISRSRVNGKTAVTIGFDARGLAEGRRYEFWTSYADGLTVKIWDLAPDAAGNLVWQRKDGSLGPQFNDLHMILAEFAKGERREFALVSTDRSVRAFTKFVPFPLEARQGSCRISLELLTPTTFALQGEGFPPGEEVVGISRSDGEALENKLTVSADGTIGPGVIQPAAVSRRYKANVTIKAKSCSVSLDYGWGPGALEQQ